MTWLLNGIDKWNHKNKDIITTMWHPLIKCYHASNASTSLGFTNLFMVLVIMLGITSLTNYLCLNGNTTFSHWCNTKCFNKTSLTINDKQWHIVMYMHKSSKDVCSLDFVWSSDRKKGWMFFFWIHVAHLFQFCVAKVQHFA
jgi:hypothetical protein